MTPQNWASPAEIARMLDDGWYIVRRFAAEDDGRTVIELKDKVHTTFRSLAPEGTLPPDGNGGDHVHAEQMRLL